MHEKDAYVCGLHPEMQMKIKTLENFTTYQMNDIVDNTVRLEVAGVKSACKPIKEEVNLVQPVPSGVEKLMSRLDGLEEAVSRISVGGTRSNTKGNFRRQDGASSSKKVCWNCGDVLTFSADAPKDFALHVGSRGMTRATESAQSHVD